MGHTVEQQEGEVLERSRVLLDEQQKGEASSLLHPQAIVRSPSPKGDHSLVDLSRGGAPSAT